MLYNLFGSILWFTLISKALDAGDENIKQLNESRLVIHEKRRLVASSIIFAAIGTIATVLEKGINFAKNFKINDDGAKFRIDNYFKFVDLHHKETYVREGSTLQPPRSIILKAREDNGGGAFDDSGPGDSAGYVSYEITDPITHQKYCIEYEWGSEAESLFGRSTGGNFFVAAVKTNPCPTASIGWNDLRDQLFRQGKIYCGSVIRDEFMGNDIWIFSDCDDLNSEIHTDYANYRVAHVSAARRGEIKIQSTDAIIGVTISVSTPDGDVDHPSIKIDIGPYKKIFGQATSGNYFSFIPHNIGSTAQYCKNSASTLLGLADSATICHQMCRDKHGKDCKYFVFSVPILNMGGWCISYDRLCPEFQPSDIMYIYNNINYVSEYELLVNNRQCGGQNVQIGTYETPDQCWDQCKSTYGDNCRFFKFGYGSNFGHCYMESASECAPGRFIVAKYNIYRKIE